MGRAMGTAHYNGTAGSGTVSQILFARQAQHIHVRNLDGTNGLDVSFDGGKNFCTIKATSFPLDIDCLCSGVWVRGVGGAVAYSIVTNEG